MQPVQRAGHANRLIVRNSKVYASTLAVPHINGLFAFRDIDEGEILVQYKGPILTQKQANESKSEYLFDLWYRSREGAETVVKKTLDGEGELAGFANHAPESLANAKSVDLLPKIIDHDIFYEGRHALVLVAKAFIPMGIEIRFNYNADQGYGGPSDSVASGSFDVSFSGRSAPSLVKDADGCLIASPTTVATPAPMSARRAGVAQPKPTHIVL